jgi:hypothetical protein
MAQWDIRQTPRDVLPWHSRLPPLDRHSAVPGSAPRMRPSSKSRAPISPFMALLILLVRSWKEDVMELTAPETNRWSAQRGGLSGYSRATAALLEQSGHCSRPRVVQPFSYPVQSRRARSFATGSQTPHPALLGGASKGRTAPVCTREGLLQSTSLLLSGRRDKRVRIASLTSRTLSYGHLS